MSPRAVDKRARPGNEAHRTACASPTDAIAALKDAGHLDVRIADKPVKVPADH
ncbi:hypothetical protein [Kribbella kalugense]|uniref:Uncharacterized protein n=1 Tax=Kribbella kalugense TaxID=2512221 RepID=A0A4R7ZNT8_9ACTN|nr:hypothetical protein [Kribbella kalugense]TDW18198.1 hypothetical protein EV650_4781 [Kribbella kalugense]